MLAALLLAVVALLALWTAPAPTAAAFGALAMWTHPSATAAVLVTVAVVVIAAGTAVLWRELAASGPRLLWICR